jgi:dTDP-4-amino-4,6-dideoxy-D-galactose acyltransferase
VTLALPDWLDHAMPELVRDYLGPPPAMRARNFRQSLERCAESGCVTDVRRNGAVDAVAGMEPLAWDSRHFGLGFARLGPICLAPQLDAAARTAAVAEVADRALQRCREMDIAILLRRMVGARAEEVPLFQERRFQLVDRIVTLTAPATAFVPDLLVRPAASADRDALLAIARNAFPHSRFLADPSLDQNKARAVYVGWLETLLSGETVGDKSGQGGVVLVAEHADKAAGFVAMRRDSILDEFAGQPIASMEMFAVAEVARGRGLGSALLAAARNWSARNGAKLVEASTWSASDVARRSYARAGFEMRDTLLTFHGRVS